jgi:T4 RnlA family RNA ligase
LIVSRKFHKFHNVNERPEYLGQNIDWTRPHWILDKLDGSMLTPFVRKDGNREWHTKMGATDVATPVNAFVRGSSIAYDKFTDMIREMGSTPMFEWCSNKQRIVIDHPVDKLILTAIRNNLTGKYVSYPDMKLLAEKYGVPVVKALDSRVDDVQLFLNDTKNLLDAEGYVVRFEDGSMCKSKGDWYCTIHKTHDLMKFEKDIWHLILSDLIDDAKPNMKPEFLESVTNFEAEMFSGINDTAKRLNDVVTQSKEALGNDKKRFALEVVPGMQTLERSILFQIWDGKNPVEVVKKLLLSSTGTQNKVNEVRHLAGGVSWDAFNTSVPMDDE